MPFCSKCGKEVPADASFCPSCGHNLKQATAAKPVICIKECPRCGGETEKGYLRAGFYPGEGPIFNPLKREAVRAYRCKNCGYIVLYSEKRS